MATKLERCNCCGTQFAVSLQAQTVHCPVCRTQIGFGRPNYYNGGYAFQPAPYQYNYNYYGYGNGLFNNPNIQTWPQGCLSPPSLCGRKRAVLCGVSYLGHPKSLKASVNDVTSIKSFLIRRFGFPNESILVLTEYERNANQIPTKQNIRMALRWLVQGCKSGDSLVFYYSGHASQVVDRNWDEMDGNDEALCPVDYETEGKILDDEINATLVRPLPYGVKLHAIIDTCSSGTFLDLPFVCRVDQQGYYQWRGYCTPYSAYKGTSGGLAISFSACDDNQFSGEATGYTDRPSSVMTYSFIQALENEPQSTYGRLLNAMRNIIHEARKGVGIMGQFASPSSQEPQLSSTEKFEIYSQPLKL